jgi:deoxyribose-phosphate aldolase
MVMSLGLLKSKKLKLLETEIASVKNIIGRKVLKVIIETAYLSDTEIIDACKICADAGADFVKTSTGFNGEGAQDEHVKLMLKTANHRIQVKPSGGIFTKERAQALITLGATRLGVAYNVVPTLCEQDRRTTKTNRVEKSISLST